MKKLCDLCYKDELYWIFNSEISLDFEEFSKVEIGTIWSCDDIQRYLKYNPHTDYIYLDEFDDLVSTTDDPKIVARELKKLIPQFNYDVSRYLDFIYKYE